MKLSPPAPISSVYSIDSPSIKTDQDVLLICLLKEMFNLDYLQKISSPTYFLSKDDFICPYSHICVLFAFVFVYIHIFVFLLAFVFVCINVFVLIPFARNDVPPAHLMQFDLTAFNSVLL